MTTTRFGLLRLSALTLILTLASLVQAQQTTVESATEPVPRLDKAGWMARHEKMNERVQQGNVDLLLIGDSITHGWEGAGSKVWKEYYEPRNAVNLGIGGDRTQHVLWRLQNGNIDGISPKAAVLMIGTNNAAHNAPKEIFDGIAAIVGELRKSLPETEILVLAIFPRGANDNDPRRQVNEKVNAMMAEAAPGLEKIHYLNINDKFLEADGTLTREIMPDLLHPKEKGYGIWAEAMEPTLKKLMGE